MSFRILIPIEVEVESDKLFQRLIPYRCQSCIKLLSFRMQIFQWDELETPFL
jgi:hypothetical protein